MAGILPDFTHETEAMARGACRVVGVDEVGRGPLAGPVTACAVRLDRGRIPQGLHDSKLLTAARREALFDAIMAVAEVAVAHASVEEIDRLNILRASHLAMERAVAGLQADHALIDGNLIPRGLGCAATAITRDRIMVDLAQQHPGYGWEANAGYPTKAHLEALQILGVTPWHRRSFRPVHNILYQGNSVTS